MNDLDTLCELLVSDKLKTTLPPGILNYVLSLEGNEWFEPFRVAGLADTYAANHDARYGQSQNSGRRLFNGNSARQSPHRPMVMNVNIMSPRGNGRGQGNYGPSQPGRRRRFSDRNQGERRCFICETAVHLAHNCPKKHGGNNRNDINCSNTGTSGRVQINLCLTVQYVPECILNVVPNECAVPTVESEYESV